MRAKLSPPSFIFEDESEEEEEKEFEDSDSEEEEEAVSEEEDDDQGGNSWQSYQTKIQNQKEEREIQTCLNAFVDLLLDNTNSNTVAEEELFDFTVERQPPTLQFSSASTTTSTPFRAANKAKNSLLADSYKHNRTFVIRGCDINVFGKNNNEIEYKSSFELKTPDGNVFSPASIMLHQQDSKLLCILDESDNRSIYALDIKKGKIIQEWNTQLFPIHRLAPIDKYAQQEYESIFVVLNKSSFVAVDSRTTNKELDYKLYSLSSHRAHYTCLATTQDGCVAVGGDDGDIKLYSGVPGVLMMQGAFPKTAKSIFYGCAEEPINFIDVSANGRWVIATSTKCLLLIYTETNSGDSAFKVRTGREKPPPIRLTLLQEDVIRVGSNVNFTPVRFNTGCDGELWIVTSTGPFIIVWNLKRVQKKQKPCYSIKKMEENVVMNQFVNVPYNTPGRDAPIIVVTENNIKLEKRSKFQVGLAISGARHIITESQSERANTYM